jgi:aerotaxis receptor
MVDYNNSAFICEYEVPKNELIISKTDLNGKITYVNDGFVHVSGYSALELIGQPHNIVRHPDMPSFVFQQLWHCIKEKNRWEGIVKNLRKDGMFYWVLATISAIEESGQIVGYKSVRIPVSPFQKLEKQKEYDKIKVEHNEKVRVISYEYL